MIDFNSAQYKIGYHPEGLDRGSHAPLHPGLLAQVDGFLAMTDGFLETGTNAPVSHQKEAYSTADEEYRDELIHGLSRKFDFDIDGALTANEFHTRATIGQFDRERLGIDEDSQQTDIPVTARLVSLGWVPTRRDVTVREIEIPNVVKAADGSTRSRVLRILSVIPYEQ